MEGTVASSAVKSEKHRLKVKKKTLQAVLEKCQKALESLCEDPCLDDEDESSSFSGDNDADELCDLLKSQVECCDFLEKLVTARTSVSQHFDEYSSWDMVSQNYLWNDDLENPDLDEYVLVGQEDIVDGITCFMAAYLLSIKQTKDMAPNQLQDALSKTFSTTKEKGKLLKAWDGSKVIYNVASWGATVIGIYQNPVILRVSTAAFWTSCHVISKII